MGKQLLQLTYPLGGLNFIFHSQQHQPAVSLFISLWLASCHQNTEKYISAKKAKVPTEKQPFVDPTGYLEAGRWGRWAGGHAGCLWADCGCLGTARLAAISCRFWPERQSGRVRRCKKQSSNLFPSLPSCLEQPDFFSPGAGAPCLCFIHMCWCLRPVPVMVAFVRDQHWLHLGSVLVFLLIAVGIQDRFQRKKMVTTSSFCPVLWHVALEATMLAPSIWDMLARMSQSTDN